MGLRYEGRDFGTRRFMLDEIEADTEKGRIYLSSFLNPQGRQS